VTLIDRTGRDDAAVAAEILELLDPVVAGGRE
jgi:hypothetical protein